MDLNRTWVTLTQPRGTPSSISLFLKQKRERDCGEGGYACFLQVRKHLQSQNSGTASQMKIKLTWPMYHLSTFDFKENKAVNDWAGERYIQKNTKKCHEIKKISTLTSPRNSLRNTMKVEICLLSSLTIWL